MTSLRMLLGNRTSAVSDDRKYDTYAVLIIFLLPLLFNLPGLLDWWSVDPIRFVSGLTSVHGNQMLPGYPWIDPSVGHYSQALGKLAADEWLSGRIPWWNYYSGVGLPLAAEMSPAALFLPFVLLNHFSGGILYIKVILQILSGIGTYFLLRKIGLTRLSAVTGALLYEFSGVFAWHTAPVVNPIPFLPWLIFGVESAREKTLAGCASGCVMIAIPLAFSIYSGFPETAYIDGLLVGVWSLWRIFTMPSEFRYRFIKRLAIGVIVGLLLSMPAIIPFVEFCSRSYLGGHAANGVGYGALRTEALPQFFFPWMYGSIFCYFDSSNISYAVWANVGGYFSAAQLTIIALGLFTTSRSSLYIVLVLWILTCLGRTFGLPFVSALVDLVPLLKQAAFFRYSPPTWEFCSAVLCAIVINDISLGRFHTRKGFIGGLLVAFLIAGSSLFPAYKLVKDIYVQDGYPVFLWASLVWGFGSMVMLAVLFKLFQDRYQIAARAVSILLAIDAIALFSVACFSGVTSSHVAITGVNYLKSHIGLDRFYTLGHYPPNFNGYGPIVPNYGAYFRVAAINHNYLPIAENWVDYFRKHIDPYSDPVCFTGNFPRADANAPSQSEVLRENLSNYADIGVRFIVTPHEENPFRYTSIDPGKQNDKHPQRVFESSVMDIYELSGTKSYFDVIQGNCDLRPSNRSMVAVNCTSETQLVRRELYYPGWTASAGGRIVKIKPYNEIFQSIDIPPGKYEITFAYTPTNWFVTLALFLVGVFWVALDAIRSLTRDRKIAASRSANAAS